MTEAAGALAPKPPKQPTLYAPVKSARLRSGQIHNIRTVLLRHFTYRLQRFGLVRSRLCICLWFAFERVKDASRFTLIANPGYVGQANTTRSHLHVHQPMRVSWVVAKPIIKTNMTSRASAKNYWKFIVSILAAARYNRLRKQIPHFHSAKR